MLALVRPTYLAPVHGEARHQHAHARLAHSLGTPEEHVFVTRIGDCLELQNGSVRRAGSVESGVTLVDGLGIGDIGDIAMRDRKQLSADGTIIVVYQLHETKPDTSHPRSSPGSAFEGAERAESLLDDMHTCARDAIAPSRAARPTCCRRTSTTTSPSSSMNAHASAHS